MKQLALWLMERRARRVRFGSQELAVLLVLVRTELEIIDQERNPDDLLYGNMLRAMYRRLSGRDW